MLIGVLPVQSVYAAGLIGSPTYPPVPNWPQALPDADKYGALDATYERFDNAQFISTGARGALLLYYQDDNQRLAEGDHISKEEFDAGVDWDQLMLQGYPFIPTEDRQLILDIAHFNTQETRIELCDANGQYLGLIAHGLSYGQRFPDQDFDYTTEDPDTKARRSNGEFDENISNKIYWDGKYLDSETGEYFYPGQEANGDLPQVPCDFIIAFQPAGQKFREYRMLMKITVAYNEEAYVEAMAQFDQCPDEKKIDPKENDPVYMVTGNFLWNYTDFSVYGAEPLDFIRHYNAQDKRDSEIGFGWRHNYMVSLELSKSHAIVTMENGYKFTYNIYGDGSFNAAPKVKHTLVAEPGGYLFTTSDKTQYHFNANGLLTSTADVNGNVTSISRNGNGISSVSNHSGALTFTYSGGKISRITDQTDRSVYYTYNSDGDLTSFLNADNDTIDYTYDDDHNITEISDFNGNTYLKNTYDSFNRIVEQYMADQGTSRFAYYPAEGYSKITDPEGAVREYHYDQFQNVTKIVDVNGDMEYEYVEGRIVKITDRLNNSTSYTYDTEGNQTSVTYPDGTSDSYEYNSLNLVTKQTAKDGTVTIYGYDSRGNLTSYTDANGHTITNTYDGDNNLLTSTNALGDTTSYTYDAKGNCLTQADPLGHVTRFEYDSQGRLVKQLNADGSTVAYEFSTAGKLVKTTDAEGNEQSYLVNGNGYGTGDTDPMGFSTSTDYNDQNKPVSVTDAEGNTTTYAYDSVGSLIKTTDALGHSVRYDYDLAGRMVSMTDARGYTWYYTYDAEGRMTATTDPLDNITATAYNSMGRTTHSTNARGFVTSYDYDNMGRTTKTTDALGHFSRSVYDAVGNLVEQYDKNNNKWTYEYDANNRMTKAVDPLGYETTYVYDANGRRTKVVNEYVIQSKSEYDNMGRLIKSIDAEGNETEYVYDILGRQAKTIFADGTFTTSEYNDNGWLVKSTDQNGAATSYTYNKNGQMLTVTDAMGGVTTNTYDALGRTISVTDALGGVTSSTYDESGNLLTSTDALGHVTSYQYDELGRVICVTDPNGGKTKTRYDANGNVIEATAADGGVITYEYDALDRLIKYTDAEKYTFRTEYDPNGNTAKSIDGRGNSTATEYDALNRAVKHIDANSNASATEYDAEGRVIKAVDAEGAVTQYEYDKNGNVTKTTDALGNSTTVTYDALNRVSTTTDAKGAVTSYTYTPTGQVATVTDALGGVKRYVYNLLGQVVKETNELGQSTTYTYDALGRVLSTKDPLGHASTFIYDATSRITAVTDKNGNVTKYKYDANGNVVETIDALNHSSYFAYDAMDRLVKVTLWRDDTKHSVHEQQVTLYSYDKRGLVTKTVNAVGNANLCVYDENGNLIQTTDEDGYVTTFGYDPRNLVEGINYAGGKKVTFQYNKNGELVEMVDWNGTTSFALDLLGQITSVNDHNGMVTSYKYDEVGNQTEIAYPDDTAATYEYDLLRRMTKLTDAEKQNTVYAYDAASQLISQAYPNGWKEENEYDATGQLLKIWDIDPSSKTNKTTRYEFSYDPNGNVTREYRRGTGQGQRKEDYTHTYDALNRLASTTGKWGAAPHTYQYDSLGNLVYEKNANGNNKGNEYWYNNLNQQIKKQVDGKDTYSFTFDKRGNLVKGMYDKKNTVSEQYVYDATNRMVKGTNEAGEESHYIFNGLGYLVSNEWIVAKNAYGYHGFAYTPSEEVGGTVACDRHKNTTGYGHEMANGNGHHAGGTTGGATPTDKTGKLMSVHKDYVLDYTSPLKDVILETESGGLSYRYTYGLEKNSVSVYNVTKGAGGLVQNSQVKLYYHKDRLGSSDFLTDNVKGKVTSYIDRDAWGNPEGKAVLKLGLRELDLVQEYTVHPWDMVLGVYFAQARMYDAGDRRFMAVDKIATDYARTNNLSTFLYTGNNPVNSIDLMGLDFETIGYEDFEETVAPDYLSNVSTPIVTWTSPIGQKYIDGEAILSIQMTIACVASKNGYKYKVYAYAEWISVKKAIGDDSIVSIGVLTSGLKQHSKVLPGHGEDVIGILFSGAGQPLAENGSAAFSGAYIDGKQIMSTPTKTLSDSGFAWNFQDVIYGLVATTSIAKWVRAEVTLENSDMEKYREPICVTATYIHTYEEKKVVPTISASVSGGKVGASVALTITDVEKQWQADTFFNIYPPAFSA